MKLIMTHGYMLSGTGSNIYVQNLCRALVREGHDVYLLCQDPTPLDYDFVGEHATADRSGVVTVGRQETSYPGRCVVYVPEIGDLLPVYVYDDYPGWRVKTFLELTDEELSNYLDRNVEALVSVLRESGAEAAITNHSLPGPLVARRAFSGTGVPYASIVHGSCLQYVSRRSEKYMALTREGLEGATEILALSSHSAGTIAEDFPDMAGKTRALPGGVDTDLFRPDALDRSVLDALQGGPGRSPEQRAALVAAVDRSEDVSDLAASLKTIAGSYDARSYDTDAGERLAAFMDGPSDVSSDDRSPLILYVGKLIHSKGVHSLISAFARIREQTGARLLVVGFGTFREGLEALTYCLGAGDQATVESLAMTGKILEGGPAGPLEHFELSEWWLSQAVGFEDDVTFIGPVGHAELVKIMPAADVGVVPSIFPETFGLVAAEFAAAGVVPFVADHSGLREAGAIVGQDLPFDLHVGMDGFEENLARALADFLSRPEEERATDAETVRRNSVEHLSWATLAQGIVGIFR